MRPALRRWCAAAPFTLLGVMSCGAPNFVPARNPVVSVKITPANDTIPFQGTVTLSVAALDVDGQPTIPAHRPVWSSLSPEVLVVDTLGLVRSVWYGEGVIHVLVDGVEAQAPVVARMPPIVSVSVTPSAAAPERGDTVQFYANAKNSAGLPASVTSVHWASSDTTKVRIDSSGKAVTVGIGPATVTATIDSVSGSAGVTVLVPTTSVTVTPAVLTLNYDDTASFVTVARDSAGNLLNRMVRISISPLVSTVPTQLSPSGMAVPLHAIAPGKTLVVASEDKVSDTLTVTIAPLKFMSVAAGFWSSCGLTTDSAAFCWGYGAGGQLGNSDSTTGPRPRRVVGGLRFASLFAGEDFACGLTADGSAWCWGDNNNSRLGRSGPSTIVPGPVNGGYHFATLSSEGATCGLTTAGQTYCWGVNWGASPVPIGAPGLFDQVTVGGGGYCGTRATDDSILCWDPFGQTPVPLAESQPVHLQANGQVSSTCGLIGGAAYCWGSWPAAANGGNGIFWLAFPGTSFTSIASGDSFFCGITVSGDARCAGYDGLGQLGDGGGSFSDSLVTVRTPVPLLSIKAGYEHTCGMGADGKAYCWGDNEFGQSGGVLGTNVMKPQPVSGQ